MPHLGSMPSLPFSGAEPLSRYCSARGAQQAEPRAGSQTLALLEAYRQHGPLTDSQAAKVLGLLRSTINARRGWLVQHEWVTAIDTVQGDYGVRNVRWGLR